VTHLIPSDELIRKVRAEIGPQTLLAFSGGKDSLACFLALRDHFKAVIPYYLYRIPGLEFVEEQLAYYEKAMGQKIIRLPHEALPRWLNSAVFQSPSNAMVIQAARLPEHDYGDIIAWACEIAGLDHDKAMSAIGLKATDGPQRRLAFSSHGVINRAKKQYYPIWDWNKEKVTSTIAASGVKLSSDYKIFGRSFDGLDYRFMSGVKKHFPRDWKKIELWFPLVGAELYRYEQMGGRLEAD
jgi:hypothetical protein